MTDKYGLAGVKTFEYTKIVGLEHISFGENIIIDDFVFIYATNKIAIGNHVHIASFSSITGGGILEIADFANISSGVRIATGSDDFKDWGFGGPPIGEQYRNVVRGHIRIGRFCVIGANSVVLPNVRIGEGVSVGAGSVVTRDLAPWGVYIGNKRVGERNKDGILHTYARFLRENEERNV